MARSTFGMGLKLLNGTALPKLPMGSSSPKLPLRATHTATVPDDTAQRPKKPLSFLQRPPTPRAAQGFCDSNNSSGAKAELPRQSSWESKQPPTSSKLLPGSGESTWSLERDSSGSSAGSPAHGTAGKLAKASQKAKNETGSFCTSQEPDCSPDPPAVPGNEPAALRDSKPVKPKPSLLASAALELSSTMSPPPAKKLVLSAKKVSLSFCPESSVDTSCLQNLVLCWGQVQSSNLVSHSARDGWGEPQGCSSRSAPLWVGVWGQAPAVDHVPE